MKVIIPRVLGDIIVRVTSLLRARVGILDIFFFTSFRNAVSDKFDVRLIFLLSSFLPVQLSSR